MLADNLKNITNNYQNYSSDEIEKSASIENAINVIKSCIPTFITNFNTIVDEDTLTEKLIPILNYIGRSYKFEFINQPKEKNRKNDIGVGLCENGIMKDIYFFRIEAKRLPMPQPTNPNRNNEEYVYSNSNENGGIERFKKNAHGVDAQICGMIAYIQENDFKYWLKQVNTWINNKATKKVTSTTLKWNKSESLSVIKKSKDNSFQELKSLHTRTGSSIMSNVQLRHIWINLNWS